MLELVSVVITTYKREPAMLERAVNSVFNQTYPNIEVIVVDDSPSEYVYRKKISQLINGMADNGYNIKYVPHEKNMGACAARNTGMNIAKGIYIAFLDDDDEWLSEKIEKQVQVMKRTDVALVYCGSICQNDDTGKVIRKKTKFCRGDVFNKLLYSNFIESTSFPLIKLKYLKKIGGFDTLMESSQDYDVWLRIAKDYEVDFVDEPLVIYHEHSGEKITSDPNKKIQGLERLNKKYQEYIDSDILLWWRRHIIITIYYARNGEKNKAIKKWHTCIKRYPYRVLSNLKYLFLIIRA